ncbi:hypothetical protein IWW50_003724 [Coemansia erecta]|nr:hypothetical protein IWW50_003724 [Coemansia erecta]
MPASTDDLHMACTAVANSLDTVSKAIQQHAATLRQAPQDLQSALRILFATTDTPSSKIVVTGVGKSFLIGKKLAATLTSVGTRAVSLHATEALHGDLGIIQPGDCVLALSYSGETDEIIRLVSVLHKMRGLAGQIMVVGMGGAPGSRLGAMCDAWIACPVEVELSADVRAPTVSSSLMLAVGDAIAIVLMNRRKFGPRDFAQFHPGGVLGQL